MLDRCIHGLFHLPDGFGMILDSDASGPSLFLRPCGDVWQKMFNFAASYGTRTEIENRGRHRQDVENRL